MLKYRYVGFSKRYYTYQSRKEKSKGTTIEGITIIQKPIIIEF